jgi:outer membrane beta-barrel protein
MNRKTIHLMSCLVLLSAGAALAEESGELVEKVAVRNRLFSVAQRWEVGANVGFTLLTRLTDHYNLNLSGAYNVTDWLAFELRGGYAISRLTSLAQQIQQDFYGNTSISRASDAADLWQMTGNAVIGARFQPIYGKINLLAELPVHFQLYLWAGGGAALLKQESLVLCSVRVSPRECGEFVTDNKVSPLVSLALGFRFFAGQHHSVKLEARNWSYLDSFYIDVDRAAANPGNPTAGGRLSPNAGITNLVQVDLGYSFIF